MSKTQPWWKMRKPFKVALGITAGPLLIVGFLALLLLIPTQTDEVLYATKPPVPKKVEEPQPLTEEQEARRVAALRRAAATRLNKQHEERRKGMSSVRDRIAAHAYWIDPGRHFAWSDLEYSLTSMPGVLTITGRIKNVGERDASKIHVKISLRDAQGREVGRGNVDKYDGLKSGESWWFDGLLTARESGGVALYMGPESIIAFGDDFRS